MRLLSLSRLANRFADPHRLKPRWWMLLVLVSLFSLPSIARGQFDLQLTISNPQQFTPSQLAITQEALAIAEAVWEREIIGYQPGITQTTLPIDVTGTTTGFADANGTARVFEGGFWVHRSGAVRVNRGILEEFANFGDEGINIIDELMAHEIGHVLGIGTLWDDNGVYVQNSGRYTGQFGLAAYRREFDPNAAFIPVELSGPPGSRNAHWDQVFRGGGEAGMADDPFTLSPLTGILDEDGRDLAGELLTAALDPDIGEPFLSRFTVESLRDIGFVVRAIPEPSTTSLWLAGLVVLVARRRRCGSQVAGSTK